MNYQLKAELTAVSKQFMLKQITVAIVSTDFSKNFTEITKYHFCFQPLIIGLESFNKSTVLDKVSQLKES